MEQEFKIKSKNIRISPSPSSWDAIRQRLDQKREHKIAQINWKIGIAASLIGILFFMSFLFLNRNKAPHSSSPESYTTEFLTESVNSDIYWQISSLHQAYSKLNLGSSIK